MCLDIVKKTFSGKSKKIQIGYKVFSERQYNNKTYLGFQCYGEAVEFNKWLTAKTYTYTEINNYAPGFHILKTRKDAVTFIRNFNASAPSKIVRVRYKGVLAEGAQYEANAVVAKLMYVPKPKEKR